MLVIGVDPGTATTGYGLVREEPDGSLVAEDYGAILTPATVAMPDRLLWIFQRLQEVIHFHRPDSGAVEKLFFHRNVSTALSVGQARGVVLLTMAKDGLPIMEYTPLEVKQAVTGYGSADKMQVQLMVKAILGLKDVPKPDDIADALAIAICHLHSSKLKALEH